MKCKSWSNKLNNFVVRKLKSFKINGQQQVLSTMPAMPKEKTSPIPLTESNFSEMKIKEQFGTSTTASTKLLNARSESLATATITTTTTTTTISVATTTTQIRTSRNSLCSIEDISSTTSASAVTTAAAAATTNGTTNLINSINNSNKVTSQQQQQQQKQQLNNNINNCSTTSIATNKLSTSTSSVSSLSLSQLPPSPSSTMATTTAASLKNNILAVNEKKSTFTNGIANDMQQHQHQHHQHQYQHSHQQQHGNIKQSTTTMTGGVGVVVGAPAKKSAKDYVFGKYIGEGSFSTVYLAKDVHTNKEYAIKVCDKQHILREKKQEYVRREREVMHIMNNVPGFVNLSCTFQDYRNLYFVMTYAKHSDLLPYINKVGSFDLDCTRHYAAELILAMEQMHKRGIVHRDLKPENILLDENMHTLIADFGSAKILGAEKEMLNIKKEAENENETQQFRRRKGSFVGTAQYVSPEVLQGNMVARSADLWALGCIIYQMISGLPPFRGGSDYLIFKEIMNLNLVFPEGFDKNAEDLVRLLLKLNPDERIGAQDKLGRYESIRTHPFFEGINWDTVRHQTPPPIYPYLPGVSKDEELRSHYRVPDNLEPGLDDKQLTRLLGLELGTVSGVEIEKKTESKNNFDLSESEKQKRLEAQRNDKWDTFAEGEVILKKGFVSKRKGLFARKRMLLLTTGPRLIYIDPFQMIKKGEIPWSPELRVEPKSFKIFFVHTPSRSYYLEDSEGYALEWVDAIEDVRQKTYGNTL